MNSTDSKSKRPLTILLMAVLCLGIIATGVVGMKKLAAARKPPARKARTQNLPTVTTIPATRRATDIYVTGYGQAAPVHVADISPQVSGKIVKINPDLDQGRKVEKGTLLFKIDATDYEADVDKAAIQVALNKNTIQQLTVSMEKDQLRLTTIHRNTKLAGTEFKRLQKLYEKERVGTLSEVEQAEQSYNSLLDTENTLKKTIALYPLEIAEAQNQLADARSDLETARRNVDRCEITAPFTGRIQQESVDEGAHIATGTSAMTLADDTFLEIQVHISDHDAFEILKLREDPAGLTWFARLDEIICSVETMTGDAASHVPAVVDRAVTYDEDARTLCLAVRVDRSSFAVDHPTVPVLDGMFCRVTFTARHKIDAVQIPMAALNSDDTVHVIRNGRLATIAVSRVLAEGDDLYIQGPFKPRDRIITTRLSHPIENMKLLVYGTAPDDDDAVTRKQKVARLSMATGDLQ